MTKKRGVSPLIATVLLIVLVIVLAVIVMTFGKGITQGAQESTARSLTCIQDVSMSVEKVCYDGADYKVTVTNNKETAISKTVLRFYQADGTITVDTRNTSISGYGGQTFTRTGDGNTYTKVQVMPIITVDNADQICEVQAEEKNIVAC